MKKLINAYIDGIKKWKQWYGRTSRRDYWLYVVGNITIAALLLLLSYLSLSTNFTTLKVFSFIAAFAYSVLQIAPTLAIQIRRLHDSNHSSELILLHLITGVGSIWIFSLMFLKGTKGDNKFGSDPYAPEVNDDIDRERLKDKTSSYDFE